MLLPMKSSSNGNSFPSKKKVEGEFASSRSIRCVRNLAINKKSLRSEWLINECRYFGLSVVRAAAAGPLIIAEVSKFCFEQNNSCIQNHKGYNESDYMDDWN